MRRNEEIRVPKVRLIGETGQQMGIVYVREALDAARDAGMDLIEVAPDANPPVCRIMDWGRYRYEQQRKEREQRRKQRSFEVKSLRLRPSTGEGDFNVTRRKADLFLRDGHKVRVEVRFRGREITHQELGHRILLRLAEALSELAEIEQHPSMEGRKLFLLLAPLAETLKALQQRKEAAAARGEELVELSAGIQDDSQVDDDEGEPATEAELAAVAEQAAAEPVAAPADEAAPVAEAAVDTPVAAAVDAPVMDADAPASEAEDGHEDS